MKFEDAVKLTNVLIHTITQCSVLYDNCRSPLVNEVRKDAIKRLKQVNKIIMVHRKLDEAIEEGSEMWEELMK